MDPAGRMSCDELLDHSHFDNFREWFQPDLEMLLAKDAKKVAKSKMHVSTGRGKCPMLMKDLFIMLQLLCHVV